MHHLHRAFDDFMEEKGWTVMGWYRKCKKRIKLWGISYGAALTILILRATCRVRIHNDPRPELRKRGVAYIFSVLHAHQVASIIRGERGTGAMVSRSRDGQIIVPALRIGGIIPIRGSGIRPGRQSKGGLEALDALASHLKSGKPAYLAVDGPGGPRGKVHKGAAVLSQRTGAAILPMVAIPKRRWLLAKAWDRLQIPKPFTSIEAYFGEPLFAEEGESAESFRQRIELALNQLEKVHDPSEAAYTDFEQGQSAILTRRQAG
jgi:lysophospholipid acyltransferase (LPLAT)-like uncharacterized protein